MPYRLPKLTFADQRIDYAMSGEDGIVEKIFNHITPASKTFVEIGINWNGDEFSQGRHVLQGNTVLLAERGWTGWWFDAVAIDERIIETMITPLNINRLFRQHGIPGDVDLFSLDVDGQDFWIWMALQARPRVVLLEVNSHFDPDETKSVEFDADASWQGDSYYGASIGAFNALARDKGYTLVYYNAANAFFVRDDLLSNPEDFKYDEIAYRYDFHKPCPPDRVWVDVIGASARSRGDWR